MSAPYVWEWNAPRPAIDPATFGNEHPEESEIARLIALFDKEREQNRQQKTADSPKYLRKIEAASDKDASRDAELTRTAKERLAAASDKDNPVLTRLYALPSYLRDPLKQHLKFLRIKQAQAEKAGKKARPASRYIHGKLTRILDRIEQTDARFCTKGYQRIVAIERLDALLTLPQLNKYEVQTAATLTASAFNCEFDRLCTQYGDDMTLNDALTVYQKLADRALLLNITPPYYESLRTDRDRRTEPDIEKLPGAFLRLGCADWWNRKLWRLRRIWREEQLRAACLVSRKKSAYLSRDALTEFREQRRRMKEFLRSYELVNEDGFTIDMADVYYSGNSNPQHRRYEMMANMKGLELIAQERGDEAVFVTVTCPSSYHATTEDGHPNPKWNGSTIRDTSDYLVNVFFAAVRKKLNRKKLRWYGVRVAEPHHDGTVHWHMMIFVRPEERETIVNEMQEIAIREDRDELGDDTVAMRLFGIAARFAGMGLGFLLSPIGLILLAIAALAVGIYFAIKYWDNIKAAIMDTEAFHVLQKVINAVVGWFDDAWSSIKAGWDKLTNWFKNFSLADTFGNITAGIGKLFDGIWKSIKSTFTGTWNWIVEKLNKIPGVNISTAQQTVAPTPAPDLITGNRSAAIQGGPVSHQISNNRGDKVTNNNVKQDITMHVDTLPTPGQLAEYNELAAG
ncbi:replication endonuclease [Salmonella enterica]|nr:replication endonuclease [Salmonella enterica]